MAIESIFRRTAVALVAGAYCCLSKVIQGVDVGYVHSPTTKQAEAQRVRETGKQIEKQNNRSAVDISVREFDITRSNFSFTDKTSNPNYRLFINDTGLALKNLSNHQNQGPADLTLRGKFMGSGDTNVAGDFLASQHGPVFNLKVAIQNTDHGDDLVGDALRLPQLAAPCVRKKQTGMGSAAERLYLFPWVASDPCYSDLIKGRDETDFPSLNLLKVPGYDFFLASSLLATRPSPSHSFVLVLVSSDRGVSGAC